MLKSQTSRRSFTKLLSMGAFFSSTYLDGKTSNQAFPLGLSSGDPTQDSVVLWTKITQEVFRPDRPLFVDISNSQDFSDYQTKTVPRSLFGPLSHYTVKLDVKTHLDISLKPYTYYFYRFRYGHYTSRLGRTKTLPSLEQTRKSGFDFKLSVFSCQDKSTGHLNAYSRLLDQENTDLVLHLGDFIYERAIRKDFLEHQKNSSLEKALNSEDGLPTTLSDYRDLYEAYLADPQLQAALAWFPFTCVWDDHDTVNDCGWDYRNECLFAAKHPISKIENQKEKSRRLNNVKLNAMRAWSEYLPMRIFPKHRLTHPHDYFHIYRSLEIGTLAKLVLTDARSYRDSSPNNKKAFLTHKAGANEKDHSAFGHSMLGTRQKKWFKQEFSKGANAAEGDPIFHWNLWGNQVLFSDFVIKDPSGHKTPLNPDCWDGWRTEKKEIIQFIEEKKIKNFIILTGDMHASMHVHFPHPRLKNEFLYYEIMTPSVSSVACGDIALRKIGKMFGKKFALIAIKSVLTRVFNPHFVYANLFCHGYTQINLSKEEMQVTLHEVSPKDPKKQKVGKSYSIKSSQT